jgi:membrane protease YdiL (CAAX protease family)
VPNSDLLTATYLFLLCLVLPGLAWHSRTRLKAMQLAGTYPTANGMYLASIVQLVLLGGFAWWVGRVWSFELFATPVLGARDLIAGGVVLAINLGLMTLSSRWRTDDERRTMFVYKLAPRSASEIALFAVVAIAAGVCEEIAYRGVLFRLLETMIGSAWPAYIIATLVFTAAHAVQGLKSAVAILVMTVLFHALVAYTGTLVVAMIVHAVYDVLAGLATRRDAIALEARDSLSAAT